jgi:S1-C subfamily serine protease
MSRILYLLIVATHFLSSPCTVNAAEVVRLQEAVPWGILSIVFQVKFKNQVGSAFAIDVDNRQYIISAGHLFQSVKDGDVAEFLIDGNWQSIVVRPIFPPLKETDIVALAPDKQVAPRMEVEIGFSQVRLGQDVYFLGFPFGLGSRTMSGPAMIPFVKKGIFSAIDSRDEAGRVIYVDGHNNPGFSGGPIIFANFDKNRALQIGGVIAGYRHQPSRVVEMLEIPSAEQEKNEKKIPVVLENTGIVVGFVIDEIIKGIRASPIGFPLPVRPPDSPG